MAERRRSEQLSGEYGAALESAVIADASVSISTRHRVVVLIPAHNESEAIAETVTALSRQSRLPDEVIVVSDNSSDDTVDLAERAGAYVTETVGNKYKKAGALNQVLSVVLPRLQEDDFVLIQDADSVLDPEFIESALSHLAADSRLGAVGGVFRGQDGGGFVGHLQRNEYARYARDVRRLKGRCLVVTGTAAVFRASTLQHVRSARLSREIPVGDGHGGVYDTTVLTEDNEISFALMHLGYKILSPKGCTLTTEVMPTWRELWAQRLRWKRGAIENCVQYGLTRVTAPYWARQLVTMLGILVTTAYLATIVWSLVALGSLSIQPFWLALTGVFVMERVITLRDRGKVRQMIAATLYELPFDIFLQVCHGKAYLDSAMNRERRW
ncbi:glycosyltransferase family 2 protein [Promicromonospora iranensis]|uniref:Cellulose synthase/poly-beta-1,6-N-acetylglucosamine synthase-like glycosyltransferase n=1 Tax=Promicromonospora iranensis TaxID=1105144 RepID=A0ABU2CH09_9MICO|nr:glycosyltransferase family 2 protein [Promicromonospora iranensis]MDR7380602.1 cellulose synthase/poly-beta-1,6-N-acetylglucosamine synthase-like glycosyltransferase [Promicromonospora iranensis]